MATDKFVVAEELDSVLSQQRAEVARLNVSGQDALPQLAQRLETSTKTDMSRPRHAVNATSQPSRDGRSLQVMPECSPALQGAVSEQVPADLYVRVPVPQEGQSDGSTSGRIAATHASQVQSVSSKRTEMPAAGKVRC
jgi:hypothetical protein